MQDIYGKYFLDENTAIRASLRIGLGSTSATITTDTSFFANGGAGRLENQGKGVFENVMKNSTSDIYLSGGMEMRKCHGRLQGFYGGELGIGFGSDKDKSTYGLDMQQTTIGYSNVGTSRVLSANNGGYFRLGLRGFIGVEYFVLPKISIGAEYGWGIMFNSFGSSEVTTEEWGLASSTATTASLYEQTTQLTDKSSTFTLDTDINNAVLKVLFHF